MWCDLWTAGFHFSLPWRVSAWPSLQLAAVPQLPPARGTHPPCLYPAKDRGILFFFIPTITLEYYLLLFILPLPFLLSLAPSPCSVFNHLLFPLYHIIFSHPSFPSLPLTPLGKSFSHPLPVSHLSSPQPPLPLPSPPYSYLSMNPQLCLN